jgi:hypothetical protein
MRNATTNQETAERRKLDVALDEALAHTFPASDPFSIGRPTGTEPAARPLNPKPARLRRPTLAAARMRKQARLGG